MHHYNCHPKVLPPIVYPTKCCDVHDVEKIQVPHIHPTHTTFHHHKIYEHIHTCPHTTSDVTDVANVNIDACETPMAGPVPASAPFAGPAPGPFGGPIPGPAGPGPIGGPGGPMPGPAGGPISGAAGPMPGPFGPWRR